ncbi:MAG: hypothetical protein IPP68_06495 [Elusimicrobia bacterium]|nr:hypothetical protein [Elusimicrobiota bacterium]
MTRTLLAILLVFGAAFPAGAASPGPKTPVAAPAVPEDPPPSPSTPREAMDALIDEGLRGIYNLDYAGSKKAFATLKQDFPDHPIGLYGLTTALWWELTNDYDEDNPVLEKEFLATADETIAFARKQLKKGDPTGEIRLCLGGALGLKGRWDAIQGHWLAAYKSGKKAFDVQDEAIKSNPELYDAYLGVGIFHYYVAVLPAAVKIFARMIFGGSKAQGLREINLAKDKGRFSRTAALLFLVNLYVNNEKDPAKALALLREGRKEFPNSPFFHFAELLILDEARDWSALRIGAQDFLARIRRAEGNYGKGREHMGLFALGNSYLIEGDVGRALDIYEDVLANHHQQDRWISLTYLHRGMAYDLRGRRDLAVADYNTVLDRRDVWELHDKARALLKHPYQAPRKKH